MRKTSGLAEVIAQTLEPMASRVKIAFVFGSVAQGKESADSDIDVMVIGDVGFSEISCSNSTRRSRRWVVRSIRRYSAYPSGNTEGCKE